MSGSIKSYPGTSVTELGPKPASESVSVVGATGGGGLPVAATIVDPIGPHTAATSVSVTLATDEGPIDVDIGAGPFHVIVDSSALPTGAATSANQDTEIASLAAIAAATDSTNNKTPFLGQAAMAASVPVAIASDQSSIPVTAASLPLPTGAATAANQVLEIADLDGINAKTPALGQAAMAASSPVVIASNQSAVPISAASLPLPTGAATEVTLAKLPVTQGSTTSGESGVLIQGAVTTAAPTYTTAQTSPLSLTTTGALRTDASGSTQPISGTVAATQSGTWNITNVSGTVSLPTGASTAALQTTGNTTLSTISGQLPSTLGIKTSAASLSVTPASDAVFALAAASNSKTGRAIVISTYKDYTAGSVTTAAYTQIIASTSATINLVEVFDSSGEAIILAVGAAASEVDQFYIFPGGNGPVSLAIPAASRVSIKAKTSTASVGYQLINFYS